MASKTAILTVRVVSDVKDAVKGLGDVEDKSKGLEAGLKSAAAPAAGVVAALGAMGKAAFDSASEMQQSAGAVESVFGDHAAAVKAAAATAADSVGLAASEYQNMSSILGAQLKNMGTPMDELSGSTQNLIGLGADLAATFGGTTAEAVGAISSLLRGERDPIERYGVSIKQSDINARLAAEGLNGLEGAAKTQAEAQAALSLLTEQTASAQGQFAREADTAAGAQQRASAQFENAKATLGESLLPIVSELMGYLTSAATWVAENANAVKILVAVIGAAAGAILLANAAMSAWTAAQTIAKAATAAWTGIQTAFNAVMALNPITLVVLAIGALVAAIVVAYNKCAWFRDLVNSVWEAIKTGASVVWNVLEPIRNAFTAIIDAVKGAWDWVTNLFNISVPGWISSIASWFGLSAPAPGAAGIFAASGGGFAAVPALTRIATTRSAPRIEAGTPVNLTVTGALAPMSVAAPIEDMLHRYGVVISGRAVL